MHDGTIKEKNIKWKKRDSKMKTRKGRSRAKTRKFLKPHGQSKQKVNNWEASKASLRFSIPFEIRKYEPSIQDYHNGSRRLIKSSYSGTGKMNLFRCLIFKKFLFLEKGLENVTPISQPNCGNKSFWARSFDLKFTSYSEIANSDHQFFGEP